MGVGRKPKPTALKALAGNPGHRPLNKREPQPSGVPTCPSCLDATAKREWTRVSKELIAVGLLTSVDRAILASYCDAYSRWAEATAELNELKRIKGKSALVVGTKTGYPMNHPLIGIINKAADQMHKFGAELGMSPSSRTRLSVEPQKQETDDEFAIQRPSTFVRPTSDNRGVTGVQVGQAGVQKVPYGPN
jgi:P27 family predicted phage terminase small subunit